jgi:hypothetical protein
MENQLILHVRSDKSAIIDVSLPTKFLGKRNDRLKSEPVKRLVMRLCAQVLDCAENKEQEENLLQFRSN